MLRKSLHCPICGDVWKHVLHEHFTRLGPPTRECRACWNNFPTGAREWDSLDTTSRIGFLLQNVVLVLPLLFILALACLVIYFLGLMDNEDLLLDFGYGCTILAAILGLLLAGTALAIVRSRLRTRRAGAAGPAANIQA
jgi:hypothetical protein